MTARRRPRTEAPAREREPKRETTRRHVLASALALFQARGVEATTMRDIARAAGLSLGAAYYHFPSKDALVLAYYEDHQAEVDAIAAGATGTVRERLGAIFHGKLRAIRDKRAMLGAIIPRLATPSDPLSAFSAQTRAIRERAISVLEPPLRDAGLPAELVAPAASALWLAEMATMLVYVTDGTRGQCRTHALVDELLDLFVPMLPLLASPFGRAFCSRAVGALHRAGLLGGT